MRSIGKVHRCKPRDISKTIHAIPVIFTPICRAIKDEQIHTNRIYVGYDFPNVHPVDKNTMYRMRIQLDLHASYQANWPYMNHIRPVEYLTSLN